MAFLAIGLWTAIGVTLVAGLMRGFAGFGSAMLMAPIFTINYGLLYNAQMLKPEEAPKSWADLLDPKLKDEVQVALELADAERERFRLGDSNLFTVNLREQAAVDAELREVSEPAMRILQLFHQK